MVVEQLTLEQPAQVLELPLLIAASPQAAAGLGGLIVRGNEGQARVLLGNIQVAANGRA